MSLLAEISLGEKLSIVREMVKSCQIVIFDPDSGVLLNEDDIAEISINGKVLQVSLRENWKTL